MQHDEEAVRIEPVKRLKPSTLTTNKAFNIHFLLSFWNHSKISVLIPVYSNLVTVHTEIKHALKK